MVGIKWLEMPNDCMECMFCNHIKSNDYGTYGDCAILGDHERMNLLLHQKHSDCPLVETDNEPITKNDLPHCQHTDEEIAKSFIEDVEAVKDQLPCGERMGFPSTFDEFAKNYGFRDKEEIYTNGSELIPVFRVKQWLEHISTTKNDLEVLDKIRAEIWNLEEGISSYHNDRPWLYKDEVLQIIDKYKKEGEQE